MMFFPDCSTEIRGATRHVAGAPRRVVGAPRRVVGAPRLVIGALWLVISAPWLVIGAPWLVIGPPWLVIGAPRHVIGASRHVIGAPRLVIGVPWCSQVHPKFSLALRGVSKLISITPMVLLYESSVITATLKASRNALLGSDSLLKLTHLSVHFTSSQTLREAPSDENTFCWWWSRVFAVALGVPDQSRVEEYWERIDLKVVDQEGGAMGAETIFFG